MGIFALSLLRASEVRKERPRTFRACFTCDGVSVFNAERPEQTYRVNLKVESFFTYDGICSHVLCSMHDFEGTSSVGQTALAEWNKLPAPASAEVENTAPLAHLCIPLPPLHSLETLLCAPLPLPPPAATGTHSQPHYDICPPTGTATAASSTKMNDKTKKEEEEKEVAKLFPPVQDGNKAALVTQQSSVELDIPVTGQESFVL